jgi:general secretion pathway protein K
MTICKWGSQEWLRPALSRPGAGADIRKRRLKGGCSQEWLPHNRGSALLTVLWISAALAAVALSLSNTVRGETERVSTDLDSLRAYYLAAGAVDKAAVEMHWRRWYPDKPYPTGPGWVEYTFPTGVAHVEMIPECAKLDVNDIQPDRLVKLLTAMGIDPGRVQSIAGGIVGRRLGQMPASPSASIPSFQGASTSFQEIEELVSVPGVTPEILYGTFAPAEAAIAGEPRLARRPGLVDVLSPYGSRGAVEGNTAEPAVLAAVGVPESGIRMLLDLRSKGRLDAGKLDGLGLGPAAGMLRFDGNSIYTIRATARVRLANGQLSDVRRTVAARVKFMPRGWDTWIHVLRWWDTAWSY